MTKEQLAFMFNNSINNFFLEKNVSVYRVKRGGKKYFGIDDYSTYTDEEIENDVSHPLAEFKTLEELLDYEYKGKKLSEWIEPLTELNIDNFA